MVRKNIFSLTLAMLVSCIAPLFLQSSIVYAETNQEQKNGIKYVNKKLGFSLNIPKSWEGNYTIKKEDGRVSFLFTYKGKINNAIPPLFTISLEDKKEEGWNKGIRWTGELGTKGNMGYYSYYDALHLYLEGTSPGEEQETVSTMVTQVFDIFNTFKILETNEAGAKGATAEEAKPKEQGKNGGTAEKETNQETANGIKYVNEDLGFELTVPKIWKNHYVVEENDNGGVTFKFKFDSKVYDDIYLFNIYVENREYSKEEQETMGDVGILDVKNGKTYLIIENLAMYASPQSFDKYFSSVPKEGQNVIKAMSKQKKILNFKVLDADEEVKPKEDYTEGTTAGEVKSIPEENKTQPARTPKEEENTGVKAEEANGDKYKSSIAGSSKSIFKWTALGNIIDPDLDKDRVRLALRNYKDFEAVADSYFLNSIKMLPGTILLSPASGSPLLFDGPNTITYQFGHAAIVGSDGTSVIEAPGIGGVVRTVSLHEWIQQHPFYIGYIVDGATEEQAYNAAKYAQKKADTNNPAPYIGDGNPYMAGKEALTSKYREDAFYCSSLVWRSWYNQGFDIDYNDKQGTPSRNMDTLVGNLQFMFGFEEDDETVFPAEIAQDLQVIPVTKSELLLGEVVETKKEEFYPYYYGAWLVNNNEEVEGFVKNKLDQRYLLNVFSNNSKKSIRILVKEADGPMFSKAKTLYRREIKPGEIINNEVMKVPMKFPEGTHKIFVKCMSDQKEDCNAIVSIQSSKNWGLKSTLNK